MVPDKRERLPNTGQELDIVMRIFTQLSGLIAAIREFLAPTYRPEQHYMRGPGPACARRENPLRVAH